MAMTRDQFLATLATILGRDNSELTQGMQRAAELLIPGACQGCKARLVVPQICADCEQNEQENAEASAEQEAEAAAERYYEDRYASREDYEPDYGDGFDDFVGPDGGE